MTASPPAITHIRINPKGGFSASGSGNPEFQLLFKEAKGLRRVFGPLLFPVRLLGMMQKERGGYRVTRSGAYWIHRLQNEYSLSYINRLWGTCRKDAWPAEVRL